MNWVIQTTALIQSYFIYELCLQIVWIVCVSCILIIRSTLVEMKGGVDIQQT